MIQKELFGDTYERIEEIAEGGLGTIYKAYHNRLEKYVVLKKINSNVENMEFVRKETDLLKNLRHVNLPVVFDFIKTENGMYTVMDYISGKSALELIKENYVFNETELIDYTLELCDALSYLHNQNPPIIHGDIKPGNIMLTDSGQVILIDFNISGTVDDMGMMASGYSKGYASPEQIAVYNEMKERLNSKNNRSSGDLPKQISNVNKSEIHNVDALDFRKNKLGKLTDIYSLGATLFHMISGQRMDKVSERVICGISPEFVKIINKCLESNVLDRYQSVSELEYDLKQLKKKRQGVNRKSFFKKLIILGVITLVIVGGNIGFLYYKNLQEKNRIQYQQGISRLYLTKDKKNAEKIYEELKKKFVSLEIELSYANKLIEMEEFEAAKKTLDSINIKDLPDKSTFYHGLYFKLSGDLELIINQNYKEAVEKYKNIENVEVLGYNYPNYIFALYNFNLGNDTKEDIEKIIESEILSNREKATPYTDDFVNGYLALMKKQYSLAYDNFYKCSESAVGSLKTDAEILMEYVRYVGKQKSTDKFSVSPIVRYFISDFRREDVKPEKENEDIAQQSIVERQKRDNMNRKNMESEMSKRGIENEK